MYVLALILDASYRIEGEKKVMILYKQNTLLQKFWSYILIPLDVAWIIWETSIYLFVYWH